MTTENWQRAWTVHDGDEGPGFPFFLPKGMVLKNTLLDYWRESTKSRLCRSFHPDHLKQTSLGDIRTLGSLQRNMYTTQIDGAGLCNQANELSGRYAVYTSRATFIQRPSASCR